MDYFVIIWHELWKIEFKSELNVYEMYTFFFQLIVHFSNEELIEIKRVVDEMR